MKKEYAMPGVNIRWVELEDVVAAGSYRIAPEVSVKDWEDGGNQEIDVTIF